jgi:hypothetical protein
LRGGKLFQRLVQHLTLPGLSTSEIFMRTDKYTGSAFLFAIVLLLVQAGHGQAVFRTDRERLTVRLNDKVLTQQWGINPALNPDILEVECTKKENLVTFTDDTNTIRFRIRKDQKTDFIILNARGDTARTRIVGIAPNVSFSKAYIKANAGRTNVEIPEVSELVNIIMVLHKDAEKEQNMFDTKTAYYQRVKAHFSPYKDHPVIDTIQKYITGLIHLPEHDMHMFSRESYGYYFALKMNACAYSFDKKGSVVNNGEIRQIAKGWYFFDPMKDLSLFEDFAERSGFRSFYQQNKPYYDSLLHTYNQLNPIQKMQSWLDKKFGFGYGSYGVYFSPLVSGAHSTAKFEDKHFNQTLMFICRAEMDPRFSALINELLESRVVFTEIDHNYVNPVSDHYPDKINASFSGRAKWAEGDITAAYTTPYMIFNEYMTFAVYTLYVHDAYTAEALRDYLPMLEDQMEKQRGFIKFKAFNRALLEKYKQDPAIGMHELYDYILGWALAAENE